MRWQNVARVVAAAAAVAAGLAVAPRLLSKGEPPPLEPDIGLRPRQVEPRPRGAPHASRGATDRRRPVREGMARRVATARGGRPVRRRADHAERGSQNPLSAPAAPSAVPLSPVVAPPVAPPAADPPPVASAPPPDPEPAPAAARRLGDGGQEFAPR